MTAALVLLALAACKSSAPKPTEKTPYAADVERICHAEERSGALEQDPSMRSVSVANWLASNLATEESRALLGRLASVAPGEKAALLSAEAKKLGIEPCPMASVWSGP